MRILKMFVNQTFDLVDLAITPRKRVETLAVLGAPCGGVGVAMAHARSQQNIARWAVAAFVCGFATTFGGGLHIAMSLGMV